MKGLQVKRFDEYSDDPIAELNEFIKDKDVIDIKQNILMAQSGSFYSQYLVIYKEHDTDLFPQKCGWKVEVIE